MAAQRPSEHDRRASPSGLVPTLGLLDVTLIGMGTIIGAGIFRAPSEIAARIPSFEGILVLWALGGVIAVCGALVFAELGGMFPHTGGQYVFIREGFGRFAAFSFGWILLAAIVSGATAWVAGVFVDHAEKLVHLYAGGEPWSTASRKLAAAGVIAAMTLLNVRGVRLGALVQDLSMAAKIGGILLIVALAFFASPLGPETAGALAPGLVPEPSDGASGAHGVFFGATLAATGAALMQILFAVGGWQNVAAVASEIKEPQKNLPRGTLIGTFVVIALYMAVNWAVLSILGVERTASTPTPAADAAGRVVSWGEPLIAGLVALSTLAFVQAILLVTPRIFFAMAQDGVFFRAAGKVHPRWGTPWIAIAVQGLFSIAHVAFGKQLDLLEMVTVCDYVFFILCAATFFKLRITRPDLARPYRAFGYPLLPGIFLVATVAVLVSSISSAQPAAVQRAGVILAVGVVLYAFWNRGARAGASPGRGGA
ncbi:MAG: amino acid permease [Planctomycetes bacterium]|nr:amino acid permease [Planctomycetota bacterium]